MIEVYPVEFVTDFTEFYPDEESAGYAIVPYAMDRWSNGTRWGDVDHYAVDNILEWADDGAEALTKHYERKGWHVIDTAWRTQSDWMDLVIAGETKALAEAVERDYKLWLEGNIFIAEDGQDQAMFLSRGWDYDALKKDAREAFWADEDEPVTIYERQYLPSWKPVA